MTSWFTRRPEPPVPVVERIQQLPRLGRGLCWSALVAEIESERTEPAPNPWTPDDPEGAAA